jgi:hypothetical protein
MSRRHKPSGEPEDRREGALAQAMIDAVRSLGWLAPETEEEVAAIEANNSQVLKPLPPGLRDPYTVLDRQTLSQTIGAEAESAQNAEVVEELARAAREGRGKISDEVEELMKQDRETAERRMQSDDR